MSMGTNNFEIRVFQKGSRTTETRCADRNTAVTVANQFASNRANDGVKAVEEVQDQEKEIFHETTVFSYFKQDDKVALGNKAAKKRAERKTSNKPRTAKAQKYENYDEEPENRRSLILAAAVAMILAGNGALAYFFW